mgnify:CR=1 FL=1
MISQIAPLVRAYFEAHGVTAPVSFGTLEAARQGNFGPGAVGRVVFAVPEEDLGELQPVHQPGWREMPGTGDAASSARSLANWRVPYRAIVWARDVSHGAVRDEGAQLEAAEALLQWVVRALADVCDGHEQLGKVRRIKPVVRENAAGAGLEAEFTFGFPMLSVPYGTVIPTGKVNKGSAPA